jgi:hypothetical protein
MLLASTLLMGIAGAYELTARNKYCALLVEESQKLAPYLTSFSVVFNVGKLVGPPLGGWLVAFTGPTTALTLDALTYVLPIASVIWLLKPIRSLEQLSSNTHASTLKSAWQECGPVLRHVLKLTGLICVVGFFHPGLAPLIAADTLGPSPQDLGLFTSVLAAGSITGGIVLQRNSHKFSSRPGLTLGCFALITAVAQLGMASSKFVPIVLLMVWLIGAGTAGLLSSANLITQVGSEQVLRGRMAGLSQIAFFGGWRFKWPDRSSALDHHWTPSNVCNCRGYWPRSLLRRDLAARWNANERGQISLMPRRRVLKAKAASKPAPTRPK